MSFFIHSILVLLTVFSMSAQADYHLDKANQGLVEFAKNEKSEFVDRLHFFRAGVNNLIFKAIFENMAEDKIVWSDPNVLGQRRSYLKVNGETHCAGSYELKKGSMSNTPFSFSCESPDIRAGRYGTTVITDSAAESILPGLSKVDQQTIFNMTLGQLLSEDQRKALSSEKYKNLGFFPRRDFNKIVFGFSAELEEKSDSFLPLISCEENATSLYVSMGEYDEVLKTRPEFRHKLVCIIPSARDTKDILKNIFLPRLELPAL